MNDDIDDTAIVPARAPFRPMWLDNDDTTLGVGRAVAPVEGDVEDETVLSVGRAVAPVEGDVEDETVLSVGRAVAPVEGDVEDETVLSVGRAVAPVEGDVEDETVLSVGRAVAPVEGDVEDETVLSVGRAAIAVEEHDDDVDDTRVIGQGHNDTVRGYSRQRSAARATVAETATEPTPVQEYYAFCLGLGGTPILLDVPCYVGRQPSAPRVFKGPVPRLVQVPSPARQVSSTHLELRQVGASVVVTDLRSTNGSRVVMPGVAPHTLGQGDSMVVSPGVFIDIGDENIIHILPVSHGEGSEERQP